jgi:hypothetical protein
MHNPLLKPILLLLLCACISATTYAADSIKAFTTDGCSLFPDGHLYNRELWLPCCTAHDKAYWQGGTWEQRRDADRQLKQCVAALGEHVVAELMLNGVRVGGSPFWPTRFRWGYGWNYLRGYKPLNDDEQRSVQKALHDYQTLTIKPAKTP